MIAALVLRQLLSLPAPPPGDYANPEQHLAAAHTQPADDAPLDRLAAYWSEAYEGRPSNAARERLVEAIAKRPDLLHGFVVHLPVREDVCVRVKRAGSDAPSVADWLLRNCASERDVLLAAAADAQDDAEGGFVDGEDAMRGIAAADWNRAAPVLAQLAGSAQPRTRAIALSLLFAHAQSDAHRRALQSIATDVHAPAAARNTAIEALGRAEWEGRDEWLLALMSDRTLLDLRDGVFNHAPLAAIVAADPDRWIPRMTALLGHADRTVRSLAGNALAQFHLTETRADALRPLVPWIADAGWIDEESTHRLRLVQSVGGAGIVEAIPHLAALVANDAEEPALRAYAGKALAELESHAGDAAMRKALASMTEWREVLIEAMADTGALTTADLVRGLEAVAARISDDVVPPDLATMPVFDHPLPADVLIGNYARRHETQSDDLAVAAIARARELQSTDPALADKIRGLVERWPVPAADALVMERIENGTAGAGTIMAALERRASIRTNASAALKRLGGADGIASGLAAVIAADAAAQRRILAGDDLDAQQALFAAARLVREPLPIDAAAALLGKSKNLDEAIVAWLIADDSPTARAVVQARHPDRIVILGSTLGWDTTFDDWEEDLLQRFNKWDADEIFALAIPGDESLVEIVIRGARATVNGKPLRVDEVARLRTFLAELRFDELGPIDTGIVDGSQYEYVHLTRASGRRVFMNNPDHAAGSPHDQVVRRLTALTGNPLR